jgi:hypothetical protein
MILRQQKQEYGKRLTKELTTKAWQSVNQKQFNCQKKL